jgi:Domain of unknown function (DUF4157)
VITGGLKGATSLRTFFEEKSPMNTATHTQKNSAMIATSMTVPHMAVQRKCGCGGSAGLSGRCTECQSRCLMGKPVQTKLRINEPGDEYEQEAERVAERVMRMAEPAQRTEASMTSTALQVQRRVSARSGGIGVAAPIVDDVLSAPGQPLDAATRAFFEPRFGHDFSRVRVHADQRAAESAKAVNALAYTVGSDVSFGAGQYRVNTTEGRRLLAHELAHVIQQQGALASPRAPSLQRTASFVDGSVSETLNLADRVLNGQSAGQTDFVLNGSTFANLADGLKALHVPRLNSSAQGGNRVRCSFASVPDNKVSFAMRILSPGVWSTATTKAAIGTLLPGFSAACSGANASTFTVNGMPANQDQRARTRTHEDHHVDDYKVILNDVIAPWDKAVTEARSKRKTAIDADKAQCTAKLYADAVGQNQSPEDIVTAIITSVNDKGNFFHGTAAGRNVRISNPSADSNCDTVTVEAR